MELFPPAVSHRQRRDGRAGLLHRDTMQQLRLGRGVIAWQAEGQDTTFNQTLPEPIDHRLDRSALVEDQRRMDQGIGIVRFPLDQIGMVELAIAAGACGAF